MELSLTALQKLIVHKALKKVRMIHGQCRRVAAVEVAAVELAAVEVAAVEVAAVELAAVEVASVDRWLL